MFNFCPNWIDLADSQAYSATWEHSLTNVQLANFSTSLLFTVDPIWGLGLPFTTHQTHLVLILWMQLTGIRKPWLKHYD